MPKMDLQKHTLNLRPGDYDFIRETFAPVPASKIIQRLVSSLVDRIKDSSDNNLDNIKVNVNVD